MTKLVDPVQLYREALANAPQRTEDAHPTIVRVEVWPYPDLRRVWVRMQTSPFAAFPNLTFTLSGPDGEVACALFMIEIREPYQSITLHLRHEPRPGAVYRLEITLTRDEATLDQRVMDFELVFRDPDQPPATAP
jgi:hypothetical protein